MPENVVLYCHVLYSGDVKTKRFGIKIKKMLENFQIIIEACDESCQKLI